MANTVKLKRSAVASKVPTTSDLQLGELALNTYDGKLYMKKDNGTASVIEIGAGSGSGATVITSATAPSSPTANTLWWDSTNGKLKIYYDDGTSLQWVDAVTGTVGTTGLTGAAATISVGSVTTTAAGTSATITNSGTSGAAVFDFTIPKGDTGATGAAGGAQMYWNTGQSVTSTTMVDLTGLSTAITAGTWVFEVTVGYSSSSNTGGRFCMNTTSTFTDIDYIQMGQLNSNNLGATTNITTNGATTGTAYGTTITVAEFVRMTGYIVATGSGTLSVQALKVTSGTLTILNGTMTLQKVA